MTKIIPDIINVGYRPITEVIQLKNIVKMFSIPQKFSIIWLNNLQNIYGTCPKVQAYLMSQGTRHVTFKKKSNFVHAIKSIQIIELFHVIANKIIYKIVYYTIINCIYLKSFENYSSLQNASHKLLKLVSCSMKTKNQPFCFYVDCEDIW